MTHPSDDEIRQELQAVAAELAKSKTLIDRRDELFDQARLLNPPLTIKEIADLVGMTERGVAKALGSYRERHHRLAS